MDSHDVDDILSFPFPFCPLGGLSTTAHACYFSHHSRHLTACLVAGLHKLDLTDGQGRGSFMELRYPVLS